MARAIAGGQVGMNGEQYQGGQFLPNTDAPKGTFTRAQIKAIEKARSRKHCVAYGCYEVAPVDGVVAIFQRLAGVLADFRNDRPVAIVDACKHMGVDTRKVQAWCDAWVRGERWMPAGEALK